MLSSLPQNTAEERQLLRACNSGDLETVRRLAREVDVTRVKDTSLYNESPLHRAAWWVELLYQLPFSDVSWCTISVLDIVAITEEILSCPQQ